MPGHSRRTFLRGAGAAAAVTATGVGAGAALVATGDAAAGGDTKGGSLVAYVQDARSGRISVMSGEREVLVTDKALAQRLARLAD
jgi:hypothetical protein